MQKLTTLRGAQADAGRLAAVTRASLALAAPSTPEAVATALLGRPVPPGAAFETLRRHGMTLCPLPPRQGDPVAYLREVWATRQAFGRAFAAALLEGSPCPS